MFAILWHSFVATDSWLNEGNGSGFETARIHRNNFDSLKLEPHDSFEMSL